jgi:hypothetical protein
MKYLLLFITIVLGIASAFFVLFGAIAKIQHYHYANFFMASGLIAPPFFALALVLLLKTKKQIAK